jgi:hypothetical protein
MVTMTAPRPAGKEPADSAGSPSEDPPPSRLRQIWNTPAASWTRVVLLFLAVATLTHLPAFGRTFWNPDEGFLATQARALNSEDGRFYQIVVDRKPPVLPYVYAWMFRIVGDHAYTMVFIRGLAIIVHVVTAILITQIAKRRFGRHGVWAGLLYLCGSAGLAPEDAQAASFEVFMLPWTCAAFLLADVARRSKRRKLPLLGAAGMACAVGTLTKQTAGATMLPVMWRAWKDKRWAGLATVLPAFALPIVGVAVWIGFKDFFFWVFTGNGGYLTSPGSFGTIMARFWANFGICAGANAAGFLSIMYMTWRGGIRKADADLWLWLVGAFIGASSGLHFFGHYFLQLLPPIVILATGALARNGSRFRWTMLTASGLTAALFLVLAFTWPTSVNEHDYEVAQKVQVDAGNRRNPILVWGMHPEIYFMSNHPPASRYITAGFLSGFVGGGNQTEVAPPDLTSAGPLVGMAKDFLSDPVTGRPATIPVVIVDDSYDKPYSPNNIKVIESLFENYDCEESVSSPSKQLFTRICALKKPGGAAGVEAWAQALRAGAAQAEFLHPPKDNP